MSQKEVTSIDKDLELMEITVKNDSPSAPTGSKSGLSGWIRENMIRKTRNDEVSFQPLKTVGSNESPGRTYLGEDDQEESSSSSSSPPQVHRRRHIQSAGETDTGVEVEIESSCGGDACLYRKRHLNNVWYLHKTQILLCCAFLFVFLFGVMIGACGTGQCSGSREELETNSVKFQPLGDECSENGRAPYDVAPIVNSNPGLFGPNTFIFDPSMTTAEIQSRADSIFHQQQNNEMGEQRYALLFKPGTYGSEAEPLMLQIGYYTEIAGLGADPTDVQVFGKIEVYNRVSNTHHENVCQLKSWSYLCRPHSALIQIHTQMENSSPLQTRRQAFVLH